MISEETIKLFAGPVISGVATSDAKGNPLFTRSFLVSAKVGEEMIEVYIPEIMSKSPLAHIEENNKIAVVVGDVTNFNARQFKGSVESITPATAAQVESVKSEIQKLVPVLSGFFGPGAGEGWSRYNVEPSVCLKVKIQDTYEQTPRPGTGGRIN
jgi:hypothetical protein